MKGARLLVVDDTPSSITNATWWMQLGARALAGAFDNVLRATHVRDVYDLLENYGRVDHLQIWGHGGPGAPLIGNQALDPSEQAWRACARGTVWFRSCKVAQGSAGRAFLGELALRGVNAAGHISNIGALGHSYLVGVRAGARPWWPVSLAPQHSHPFAPRTVLPVAMSAPAWTWLAEPL